MATQNLTSEWTREKTIQLINEYRKNRGLWDMTHEDYRKKDVKRDLLHKVAQNIDNGKIPALEIEKKFHTLRTQYHREIHRMKKSEPYNSKWFGFKHLEFLSSPKACRQSKNFQYIKVDTQSPKVQKQQEIYITPKYVEGASNATEYYIERKESEESDSNRDSRNSRDLEKLIAETTKDVEEEHIIEEEIEDEESHGNEQIIDTKQNVIIKHVAEYNIEDPHGATHHISNSEEQLTLDDENLTYHPTGRILKIQTRRSGTNEFETHYTTADDTSVQTTQSEKKFTYAETPTFTLHKSSPQTITEQPQPTTSTRPILLDDFATYGEYVGNELRQIQGRETLIQLKHKINTSIYEALIADMQNK